MQSELKSNKIFEKRERKTEKSTDPGQRIFDESGRQPKGRERERKI